MAYRELDFYRWDELLSEEERMVRDTVRDFVTAEVMPIIARHNREGTFPAELVPQMAAMGLLGSNIKGYDCAGMGAVAYGLVCQELERGDSGLRSFVSVQGALCMYPIFEYGSEEQKSRWLPAMARGEAIGCFGLTEPDFGSNPGGLITRAEPRDSGFVLNGAKAWITNGGIADLAVVWAKTPDGMGAFLVEKGTPGFTTQNYQGKLSLRASITSELYFADCFVPASNRLPGANHLKHALRCLTQARYGIAWGAVGAACACFDEALEWSKTRIQFDKPIASFQLVQNKLSWMATEITKAQGLLLRLGRLKEAGEATAAMVSMAKMNNVKVALDSARMTRDILGANGILDEYQAMRHATNLESVYTYEGTHDIHNLIIGRELTGIAAFE
jgi:glutaryl-CoA dehydrogenase